MLSFVSDSSERSTIIFLNLINETSLAALIDISFPYQKSRNKDNRNVILIFRYKLKEQLIFRNNKLIPSHYYSQAKDIFQQSQLLRMNCIRDFIFTVILILEYCKLHLML